MSIKHNAKTKKKTLPRVRPELCKGCSFCTEACPEGVLRMGKGRNAMGYFTAEVLHPQRCTGCRFCTLMCPEVAIELWQED
jgi:2-oxoglutarate ferredoxin oxidoreductase subunit delta